MQLVAKLVWMHYLAGSFTWGHEDNATSCGGREGAAGNGSSGKGGIVRREKSTVTRFFLADWQLSSSSPALRMTKVECLRSSFSLYTRRHVGVKGEV